MIVTYLKENRQEIERFDTEEQFKAALENTQGRYHSKDDWFPRQTCYWTAYDGVKTAVVDMEDSYLFNIFKYSLALNLSPNFVVMAELQYRGLLPLLAEFVPAYEGYKSPEEIKQLIAIQQGAEDNASDDTAGENSAVDESEPIPENG